jgi:uncharacterized phiE125 gp8 family phage protein
VRLRSLVVTTHPTVEPVSLAEAKAQLSLLPDQIDDDDLIVGLIASGRRVAEARLGVALAPQQLRAKWEPTAEGWRISADGTGPAVLALPRTPVLTGGSYPVVVDLDGTTVSSSTYTVDADAGEIRFTSTPNVLPTSTLTVTYSAGPASRIAPQLRSAILLMVGHLYLHREAASADRITEVPMAVEMLLASASTSGRY